jgi:hypothetical protein
MKKRLAVWLLLIGIVLMIGGVTYVSANQMTGASYHIVITENGLKPDVIYAKHQEKLKLRITNGGIQEHSFLIPDYAVMTHDLKTGEEVTVEFLCKRRGVFPILTHTPGKREQVAGTLTVK